MHISILDLKFALAVFAVTYTSAIALQSDSSLARTAETRQTVELAGGKNVSQIAADLAKARHPKLSAFLRLLRSHQHISLNRASRGAGDDNVIVAATPSAEDRTALEIHIFCLSALVLVLVFSVASCCATADGPSDIDIGPTGGVLRRSCFSFGDVGLKPLPPRESRQRRPDPQPQFQPVEYLHVCPHSMKMGGWPFTITEPNGQEVFHVKIADDLATLVSNLPRRSGSGLVGASILNDIGSSNAKALEVFDLDGTPLFAVTSKLQVFSMMHSKAVGQLVKKSPRLYELNCNPKFSPDIFIERLPTGAFLVLPQGIHFPLACAAPVYTFPRQRIEIAFGSDAASHPMMKQTFVAALLGVLVFEDHLGD